MGWKKLIMGEKMPDKNDPKYAERRERELEAGRKTCRWLKLDKLAAKIQAFASDSPKLFLGLVFGIVIFCFTYNCWCLYRFCNRPARPAQTAVQAQEDMLRELERLPVITDSIISDYHDNKLEQD